jgi:hypothetical protein
MEELKNLAEILISNLEVLKIQKSLFELMKKMSSITEKELKDKATEILMCEVAIQIALNDVKKYEI